MGAAAEFFAKFPPPEKKTSQGKEARASIIFQPLPHRHDDLAAAEKEEKQRRNRHGAAKGTLFKRQRKNRWVLRQAAPDAERETVQGASRVSINRTRRQKVRDAADLKTKVPERGLIPLS